MNGKSIAGELGEGRPGFALRPRSAYPLAGRWGLADFAALTKPRVMALAVFTALVGMSIAPRLLDPLTAIVAVFGVAAGAGFAGALTV